MEQTADAAGLDQLWSDTFENTNGIDSGNSSGYSHDAGNKEVDVNSGGSVIDELNSNSSQTTIFNGTKNGGGQQFTSQATAEAGQIVFSLKKVGTPTGNIVAKLYTVDGSDLPDTLLETSSEFDVSTLTGTKTDITFTLSSNVPVTDTTKYAITLEAGTGLTVDGSNYIQMGLEGGGDGDGKMLSKNGSWATSGNDARFRVLEGAASEVVLQSVSALTLAANVSEVIAFADISGGTISAIEVSTDDGTTWDDITSIGLEKLASVTPGNQIKLRLTFTGSLLSWGVAA